MPMASSDLSPGNCTQRWSEWISRDNPNSAHDDVEKMTTQEMTQFCPGGHVTDIQCRSRQGFPVEDGEEGMVCNVARGLLCRDADVSPARCNDYEVRYFCRCSGRFCSYYINNDSDNYADNYNNNDNDDDDDDDDDKLLSVFR